MGSMPEGEVRAAEERFVRDRDEGEDPPAQASVADQLEAERKARRQVAWAWSRERGAHRRALEQLERTRSNVLVLEQQLQLVAARLEATEAQLAWKSRPLWRRLFRRPPAA